MSNKKILRVSGQNSEFQIITALKNNRHKRQEYSEIFIEGIEAIKQALAAGKNISRFIFVSYERLSGWAKEQIRTSQSAKLIEMSEELYKSLCDKNDPSELLVTVKMEKTPLADLKIVTIQSHEDTKSQRMKFIPCVYSIWELPSILVPL